DEMAREIDNEIRNIIEDAHGRARGILTEHRDDLDRLSEILLRRETIEREEFLGLVSGQAEADVFRAKDEKAASDRASAEREQQAARPPRGPPATPPPTPGTALPEA